MRHPKTSKLIALWAREGAKYGACGRMCDDCAFKEGTEANGEEYVASIAADCAAYDMGEFKCHAKDGENFIRLDQTCSGYLYAIQYLQRGRSAGDNVE